MLVAALLHAAAAAGSAQVARPAGPDPCSLLTTDEVHRMAHATVAVEPESERGSCVYSAGLTSVGLSLVTPAFFDRARTMARNDRRYVYEAVSGVGQDAYLVYDTDPRSETGAVYARVGARAFQVSMDVPDRGQLPAVRAILVDLARAAAGRLR